MITVAEFNTKYNRLPTENDVDWQKEIIMSKFQILDIPIMDPGKCSNCGAVKPDGRKYVDFGLSLDWYGVVYVCSHCLLEAARLLEKALGLVVVPVANPAVNRHDILIAHIISLEQSIAEMTELVRGYATVDSVVSDSGNIVDGERSVDLPSDATSGDNETVNEDESGTSKQTTESGYSNLPSLTELLAGRTNK